MTAALDSNIVIDVLTAGANERSRSEEVLRRVREEGERLIVGEAVFGELAGRSENLAAFGDLLAEMQIGYVPSSPDALYRAGVAWRDYRARQPQGLQCPACGTQNEAPRCSGCGEPLRSRQHILADFLVGAHALVHADRLLTRDRGFYATYFPDLRLA